MTTLYQSNIEHTGRLEIFENAPSVHTHVRPRERGRRRSLYQNAVMTLCFMASTMLLMGGMTFFARIGVNMISGIGMAILMIFMSGAALCAFVFAALEKGVK